MNKKFKICFISVLFISFIPLYAKYYADPKNGYSGWANAYFIGTTKEVDPLEEATKIEASIKQEGLFLGYCRKFSKEQRFLICSALQEFNLSVNDVFAVVVQEGYSDRGTVVVIVIKEDTKTLNDALLTAGIVSISM